MGSDVQHETPPSLHVEDTVGDEIFSLGSDFHKGPIYREFIERLVQIKSARNYLEIGVREGYCLSEIPVPSIGVDPLFQFKCNPANKKKIVHLYQMTSDEFFRDFDPRKIFETDCVDVTFLDGLHQFEYLLRDFMNAERVSARNSLILLDDCLPVNTEMAERQHNPSGRKDHELAGWWTGDVWKLIPILKQYRPDLIIVPVDTSPTGTVLVTNLDPSSTILWDRYFDIVKEYYPILLSKEILTDLMLNNPPLQAAKIINRLDASLFLLP